MADSHPKKTAGFRLHLATVIFLLFPPTGVAVGMMTFSARDRDRLRPKQFGAMIAGGFVGPLLALLAAYMVYRLFGRSNGWANAVCILMPIILMLRNAAANRRRKFAHYSRLRLSAEAVSAPNRMPGFKAGDFLLELVNQPLERQH